jgi:hypothetical protein
LILSKKNRGAEIFGLIQMIFPFWRLWKAAFEVEKGANSLSIRLPTPKAASEGFGAPGAGNDADMIIDA